MKYSLQIFRRNILIFLGTALVVLMVGPQDAFAGLSCTTTGPSTITVTETSNPRYCIGSSFLSRNGSYIGIIACGTSYYDDGLGSGGVTYSYTSSFGSASCTTQSGGGGPPINPGGPALGTIIISPSIPMAGWALYGPSTNQTGVGSVTLTGKSPGSYTLWWATMPGYNTPVPNNPGYSLSPGGSITFSGVYTVPIAPQDILVTISKIGNGSGTVTSVPPGIDCGASCSARFGNGSIVTYTAVANTGSQFEGWFRESTARLYYIMPLDRNGNLIPNMPNCNVGITCTLQQSIYNPPVIYPKFTLAPNIPLPTVSVFVTPSSVITPNTFTVSMVSSNATSCTWTRVGSYPNNWVNQPVPAPGIAYDSGALSWPAGNAAWFFTCSNSFGNIASASGLVAVSAVVPTGLFSPISNCVIASGASTCSTSVAWSITNSVSPSVRHDGNQFSTAVSSAGTPRTVTYGNNAFALYDNNVLLDTNRAAASCGGGTLWNGSVCAIVYVCTGSTPANATIYPNDDTGLLANTLKSHSPTNTAPKCQFSCNGGYSLNGSACVSVLPGICGDGICKGSETILTCPRDCKSKVQQF